MLAELVDQMIIMPREMGRDLEEIAGFDAHEPKLVAVEIDALKNFNLRTLDVQRQEINQSWCVRLDQKILERRGPRSECKIVMC